MLNETKEKERPVSIIGGSLSLKQRIPSVHSRMSEGFKWSLTQQIRFNTALQTQLTEPVVKIIEEWLELGAYDEEAQFKNTLTLAIQFGNWKFLEEYLIPRAPSDEHVKQVFRFLRYYEGAIPDHWLQRYGIDPIAIVP